MFTDDPFCICLWMILSACGSSGLSHCLGDCTRAEIFLPPTCGPSCQCFWLSPKWLCSFQLLAVTVSLFRLFSMVFPSLQQVQHRSAKLLPALLCLLRLGDVPRSKVRTRFGTCGHEEGHADTHTCAQTCKPGPGGGWQTGTDFPSTTSLPSHPTRSAVLAERT